MDKHQQRDCIKQAIAAELRRQSNASGDLVLVKPDWTLKVDGEFSLEKLARVIQEALAGA